MNDGTRCSWNCTIMDSHFLEEMNTRIAKKKVIRLVVKYEKKVNDKCVNQQMPRNLKGNIAEHWEIRLQSKQFSIFTKAVESVVTLMFCTDSADEHKKIMAICTLTPVSTKSTEPTYYSGHGSSPKFFQYRLADLGAKRDSIADCSIQTTDNLQPCIKITKPTGNNSSTFEGLLKCGGWPEYVVFCLRLYSFSFSAVTRLRFFVFSRRQKSQRTAFIKLFWMEQAQSALKV